MGSTFPSGSLNLIWGSVEVGGIGVGRREDETMRWSSEKPGRRVVIV